MVAAWALGTYISVISSSACFEAADVKRQSRYTYGSTTDPFLVA